MNEIITGTVSERNSHSMVMAVRYASKELIEKALQDVRLQSAFANVEILLQVLIQVLKY